MTNTPRRFTIAPITSGIRFWFGYSIVASYVAYRIWTRVRTDSRLTAVRRPVGKLKDLDGAAKLLAQSVPGSEQYWDQVPPGSVTPAFLEPGARAMRTHAVYASFARTVVRAVLERFPGPIELLSDPNPQVRYAAALGLGGRDRTTDTRLYEGRCARRTPPFDVRSRGLYRLIGIGLDLIQFFQAREEAVYAAEEASLSGQRVQSVKSPPTLAAAVELFNWVENSRASAPVALFRTVLQEPSMSDGPASDGRPSSEMSGILPPGNPVESLARAFALNDMPDDMTFLEQIPEGRLRVAIRTVSPVEASGLGRFDYLHTIDQVDELYLFLQHALFLKNYDLLVLSPATATPASSG